MSNLESAAEDLPTEPSGAGDPGPLPDATDAGPLPDAPDVDPPPEAPDLEEPLPAAADVTPHSEEALRASEIRYRNLFEAIDEGFCIVEVLFDEAGEAVDYRFIETNPAFVEHTGLDGAEGKRIREFVPEHEDHWFETYGRVALTGEPERFTNEAKELGRWYDVYAFRIGDPEKRNVAVLFKDITEHRRAEEALVEAKQAAERANEVKSQFLSTMSHELRTPLNAVIGMADLLDSGVAGPVNPEQKKHLGRIQAGAWHLVAIIEEILTFSRAEADKVDVRRVDVDVAALARGVVEMLQYEAETKGLALEISGVDDPLVVTTDPGKVRQILTNLLGNALKFTAAGGVEVEVVRETETVAFVVRDTGPGIPPVWLDAVFDPFEQVTGSEGRQREGTGLGLTICRRLATLLGGEVTVESTLGEGSAFTFRLPRNPAG